MWYFLIAAKPYLEPCQTSMMERFVKIVKGLRTPSQMSNKVLSPALSNLMVHALFDVLLYI